MLETFHELQILSIQKIKENLENSQASVAKLWIRLKKNWVLSGTVAHPASTGITSKLAVPLAI